MKRLGYAGLSTVLCLSFALEGLAQQPSPAELACNAKYGKFYGDQKSMPLFDEFVTDATCKENQYRSGAFSLMNTSLNAAKNWKGVMDLAIRFEKDIPNAPVPSKLFFLNQAMGAAMQAGDPVKVIEFGEKVLELDPANINALLILSTTISLNVPTEPAAMEKALAKALDYAKRLLASAKPPGLDDKQWQLVAMSPAHRVVGFVYLQKAQYEEAEAEFDQTVKINPKDQLAWYQYGLAATKRTIAAQNLIQPAIDEVNNNRTLGPERDAAVAKREAVEKEFGDRRDKAIDILISAVALPDTNIAKAARVTLESLYNPTHNNTNEGLDDRIAARKAELNK